jgi:hypothetical protein
MSFSLLESLEDFSSYIPSALPEPVELETQKESSLPLTTNVLTPEETPSHIMSSIPSHLRMITDTIYMCLLQQATRIRYVIETTLKTSYWSDAWRLEEDTELLRLVKSQQYSYWSNIVHPTRSSEECQKRYWIMLQIIQMASFTWTIEEDLILTTLIQKYPPNNLRQWMQIGKEHPTRTELECRQHYLQQHFTSLLSSFLFAQLEAQKNMTYLLLDNERKYWEKIILQFPEKIPPAASTEEDIELMTAIAMTRINQTVTLLSPLLSTIIHHPRANTVIKIHKAMHQATRINRPWSPKEDEVLAQLVYRKYKKILPTPFSVEQQVPHHYCGFFNWKMLEKNHPTHHFRGECKERMETLTDRHYPQNFPYHKKILDFVELKNPQELPT